MVLVMVVGGTVVGAVVVAGVVLVTVVVGGSMVTTVDAAPGVVGVATLSALQTPP